MWFCLICLGGGSFHSRELLTHMETSHFPVKGCSALVTIVQWGFCSVPHLLWHRASVYNGYLRENVTLTHIAEHLAVILSLPVFTTNVYCNWDSNTQSSAWESQFVLISGFKLLKLKWNNCALVQAPVLSLKPNLSITFLNQKLLESVGCQCFIKDKYSKLNQSIKHWKFKRKVFESLYNIPSG